MIGQEFVKHVNRIRQGWKKLADNPRVQIIVTTAQELITAFWMLFGSIPAWALMSALWFSVAFWNVYAIGEQNNIPSGLDVLTRNSNTQILLSLGIAMMAYVVLATRSKYVLTVMAALTMLYAAAIASGVVIGLIDIRGFLAAIYLVTGSLAMVGASHAYWNLEQHKKETQELRSEYKALAHQYDTMKKQQKQND